MVKDRIIMRGEKIVSGRKDQGNKSAPGKSR